MKKRIPVGAEKICKSLSLGSSTIFLPNVSLFSLWKDYYMA